MSILTNSWMWFSSAPLPGFSILNQDNLQSNLNGMPVNPANYIPVTFSDADHDGTIADRDIDDATNLLVLDQVIVGGVPYDIHEVAAYTNSTFVIGDQTFTVTMTVWLGTNGYYGVRISDADIPDWAHYSQVTSINLGTFNGVEYDATLVSTRVEPFVCFAGEAPIATARGLIPAVKVELGDMLLTMDNGFQPVRWIGRRRIAGQGAMTPVEFDAGAIGNSARLRLSPNHRVLLRSWKAELLLGESEVLVAAKHLVNGTSIRNAPCRAVTYVHFLLDNHEVLFANGAPCESLFLGDGTKQSLSPEALTEIHTLFPELKEKGPRMMSRPEIKGYEARLIDA